MKTYKVVVNFSFFGADDEFYVEANNENEAKELALDLASENLDVVSVDVDDDDDSYVKDYRVTVNFGFVVCDEEYIVDATNKEVAMDDAFDWAMEIPERVIFCSIMIVFPILFRKDGMLTEMRLDINLLK